MNRIRIAGCASRAKAAGTLRVIAPRIACLVVAAVVAAACSTTPAVAAKPEKAAAAPRVMRDFAAQPYRSTYHPLARRDTLIRNAIVLDGTGKRLDGVDVLMRGGLISAVGKDLPAPDGVVTIDAAGRWVTPGIIDPHSHLGDFPEPYTAEDSHSDVNENSDPVTAQVWAQHSMNVQDPGFSRALAGGVTTLQILPGSTNLFGGRSVVVRNVPATTVQGMMFPGAPFGMKMACGENVVHAYGDAGRFPMSRMGAVAGQRAAWQQAKKYIADWQKYVSGGSDTPPDPDLKLDTLAGVLEGDIRVHIHCYRSDDIAQMFDMAREFGFHIAAIHHAVEAYKIPELFVREGTCAAVWPDWWGYKREAYDAIRENAAYLQAAGVCVSMHSDSSVSGQRLNLEAAKAMAAGARAGVPIPPEVGITWVTSNPARMLGLADRVGTLEPGKIADVVLWSGSPFSVYSHADQVYIDGALAFDRNDRSHQPTSDFELGQPSVEPLR